MKRLKRYLLATASLTSMLLLPAETLGQGAIIFDDFLFDNASMPRDNLPGFPSVPGFFLWTVTDGSVDLVGPPIVPTARYVDLGGSTGDPGLFAYAPPISLLANVPYRLTFEYNSVDGQPATASIRFVNRTFTLTSSSTLFATFSQDFVFTETFTFAGAVSAPPSASPLTFQDLGNDNSGLGVDRIIVTPVPEPATLTMLAAGALALGAFRQHNSSRAPKSADS